MGKVPDGPLQKEDEGWKLNRSQYYSEGWLATGNVRGIVGCTFTTCACRRIPVADLPLRTNYNLRGHRAEVTIVRWNEPYQKLATCDSSGIIFVWIKYEGRWSIELINDRNTPVTDFSWSHDGRMALICYTDGFVLVGSVTGQRYWSSMLNLDSCHTTCGIWSPDDQHVFFGTSKGHVVVIQVNGTVVSQVTIREGVSIASMSWSCEKFKMEDTDEATNEGKKNQDFVLAVCFTDGVIYLMKNFDDLFPTVVVSRLESVKMEWSNNGDVLAVAGHKRMVQTSSRDAVPASSSSGSSVSSALNELQVLTERNPREMSDSSSEQTGGRKSEAAGPLFLNSINFYTVTGILRYRVNINFLLHPITALTWGHNDKRIFVATGAVLHIAWVSKKVPSLQLLSRLSVFRLLPNESSADQLNLPSRIQALISSLFGRTLRCYLPQMNHLRDFVSKPPVGSVRLHCTLIRHDDDLVGGSTTYVLYLEYLGGLVPILKGKRASKLRPEFVIFDPQSEDGSVPDLKREKDSQLPHSAPQSRTSTPSRRLSRQKSPAHASSSPLYWTSRSAPASGTESEGEESSCMTDGYGHVYSLPSPMMRRKCRRKRRGAQPEPEERSAHPNGLIQEPGNAGEEAEVRNNGNNRADGNNRGAEVVEPLKPESTYMDEMPEAERLILVTSNIWGTKFKILGLSPRLPSCLGTISYRTSVLHLQPRQMTLHIKELGSRRSSTRTDLKLCSTSPDDELTTFAKEDAERNTTPSALTDFSDSYAPIAPMTPRMQVRGQRRSMSPDRRRMAHYNHLLANARRSQSSHRSDMPVFLGEEVLTMEITGDPHRVSMELHPLPATSSGFHSSAQTHYSSHHRSHPLLLTSQASFPDFGSEFRRPYFAHHNHGHPVEDKDMFSPSDDSRPDDMIAQMARQLAAEYALSQLTTSPAAEHPSLHPTSHSSRSSAPPNDQPATPTDVSSPLVLSLPHRDGLLRGNSEHHWSPPQQDRGLRSPLFFQAAETSAETGLQTILYPVNSLESSAEAARRASLSGNCIASETSPFSEAISVTGKCGGVPAAARPSVQTPDHNQELVRGRRRQRHWQHMQHINQKDSDLIPCPSNMSPSLRPYIPISRLNQAASMTGTSNPFSPPNSQPSDEPSFRDVRDGSLVHKPRDSTQFTDEIRDVIIRANGEADVCSSHHPSSQLLPESSSLSFATSSPERQPLILSPRAGTSDDSPINPLTSRDHSDFLNIRIRSGSTPSSEVPRLTLRPFCRKSMSGVPLVETFEILDQSPQPKEQGIPASKFNCTELDGFDACEGVDDCLSCECDNDSTDAPSHAFRTTAKSGHCDYVLPERTAHRSESTYNCNVMIGSNSSVFSTPVHRANKNRSLEYKYESMMGQETMLASVTGLVTGDQQMSAGLIVPESERMDRRQRQKMQLQLHHASPDLRPSPGFASDCERIPNMTAINFALLRSNSINSSSPSDAMIRSLPASPAQRRRALGRSILNSPLVLRKVLKQK